MAQAKAKPKEFRILLLDDEEHKIQITPNTTAQQFAEQGCDIAGVKDKRLFNIWIVTSDKSFEYPLLPNMNVFNVFDTASKDWQDKKLLFRLRPLVALLPEQEKQVTDPVALRMLESHAHRLITNGSFVCNETHLGVLAAMHMGIRLKGSPSDKDMDKELKKNIHVYLPARLIPDKTAIAQWSTRLKEQFKALNENDVPRLVQFYLNKIRTAPNYGSVWVKGFAKVNGTPRMINMGVNHQGLFVCSENAKDIQEEEKEKNFLIVHQFGRMVQKQGMSKSGEIFILQVRPGSIEELKTKEEKIAELKKGRKEALKALKKSRKDAQEAEEEAVEEDDVQVDEGAEADDAPETEDEKEENENEAEDEEAQEEAEEEQNVEEAEEAAEEETKEEEENDADAKSEDEAEAEEGEQEEGEQEEGDAEEDAEDEDEDEEDEDEEYDEDAEIAAIEEKFAIPPELHIEEWMYNFKDRQGNLLKRCIAQYNELRANMVRRRQNVEEKKSKEQRLEDLTKEVDNLYLEKGELEVKLEEKEDELRRAAEREDDLEEQLADLREDNSRLEEEKETAQAELKSEREKMFDMELRLKEFEEAKAKEEEKDEAKKKKKKTAASTSSAATTPTLRRAASASALKTPSPKSPASPRPKLEKSSSKATLEKTGSKSNLKPAAAKTTKTTTAAKKPAAAGAKAPAKKPAAKAAAGTKTAKPTAKTGTKAATGSKKVVKKKKASPGEAFIDIAGDGGVVALADDKPKKKKTTKSAA